MIDIYTKDQDNTQIGSLPLVNKQNENTDLDKTLLCLVPLYNNERFEMIALNESLLWKNENIEKVLLSYVENANQCMSHT